MSNSHTTLPDTNQDMTVLVGGCFDLLHWGHIHFLQTSASYGNHLIVALESDVNVRRLKHEKRPIHSQAIRRNMLQALSCVSQVIMLPAMHGDHDYFKLVKRINPDVIAITQGDPVEDKKKQQAEQVGAKLVVVPKIHTPSTSQLAKLLGLE